MRKGKGRIRIWRVEHSAQRTGPYHNHRGLAMLFHDEARTPCARLSDFALEFDQEIHSNWIFGFRSLRQYEKWWPPSFCRPMLEILDKEKGYVLRRYDLPANGNWRASPHQAVFHPDYQGTCLVEERGLLDTLGHRKEAARVLQ
ncbi:MAG: hypothetical protein QNJ97_17745 [Myxococcota bacterium]|nr:hypothetical protein [Myxococcota bacterium]